MGQYKTTTIVQMNYIVMNKNMSLLACICIVLVFAEFESLADGPGMSFVGDIICPQASQTCCDTPPILGKDIPISNFLSPCQVVPAEMDWAADKFVWVRLANGRFRPRPRSSVPVFACPSNRRCWHPLWYAEFPNGQFYSGSWVGLRWAMVTMAPVTGGYNCCHAESDFVALPSSLLKC